MTIDQLIIIFSTRKEILTQSFHLIMEELYFLKETIMVWEQNTLSSFFQIIDLGLLL